MAARNRDGREEAHESQGTGIKPRSRGNHGWREATLRYLRLLLSDGLEHEVTEATERESPLTSPTPPTHAGDRTDFPSHPRHQRNPRSKFTVVGIAFGHTFDGIVWCRRTPATDGPYLSVSIRVHPWLPTSRSYSGAIPQDASVAAEPRWKISG